MRLCDFEVGLDKPFFLIAGICVIESGQMAIDTADTLKEIMGTSDIPFIYKSSFDKANRSSDTSFRGLDVEEGLRILSEVRRQVGVPILTDIHEIGEIKPVTEVADVPQTPALLYHQTDSVRACAQSGKPVNIKRGQFLTSHDVKNVIDKARRAARDVGLPEDNFMACERDASLGYNNLVSDMRSLAIVCETGAPMVFDATYLVQLPGGQGTGSSSQWELAPVLARVAIAVGVAGVFMGTHPDPAYAKSDGPNAVPLRCMKDLLSVLKELDVLTKRSGFLENQFD